MVAPLSPHLATPLPAMATIPVKGDAGSSPLPAVPAPSPAVPTTTGHQTAAQDTVNLSSNALDMSKALNEQADTRAELKRKMLKQEEQSVDSAQAAAYSASGKSFPPFMGNLEELKLLKESSPSLYREVLRMIVPRPLNLSPADLQYLQQTDGAGNRSKSTVTTV